MRRLITLATISTILTAMLIGAAYSAPATDKSGAFSVQVAKGWNVQPSEDLMTASGPNGIPQFNVTKEVAQGVNLAQFVKVYPGILKQQLAKFKMISYSRTTVGGVAAGVWVYTANVQGATLKFKNVVAFKKNTMYNVAFATLPTRFASDVTGCDSMMKSWKWL